MITKIYFIGNILSSEKCNFNHSITRIRKSALFIQLNRARALYMYNGAKVDICIRGDKLR